MAGRRNRLVFAGLAALVGAWALAAWWLHPADQAGPCAVVQGPVMLPGVPEASGLAVSRRHTGLLWAHNDSGNETALFAVDASGVRGRVRVPVRTRDWEDVSAAPCTSVDGAQGTSGDCLYIADIGDNDFARSSIQVFRVSEPDLDAAETARPADFTLTYPDGPHNAEALFIVESTVFIVTKDREGIVFRSTKPLGEERGVKLERFGTLGVAGVTDAETSRDGEAVVVRTSHEAIVYRTADLVRGGSPSGVRIPIDGLREPQGEGVALEGDVLYLASEGQAWNRAGRLLSLRCSLP